MNKTSLTITLAAALLSSTALAGGRVFYADAVVYDDVDTRDISEAEAPVDVAYVERSPLGEIEIACWMPGREIACEAYSEREGWLEVTAAELLPYGHDAYELKVEVATGGCWEPDDIACKEGVISAAPLPSP